MPEHPSRSSDSRIRLGRGLAALLGDAREDGPSPEALQGIRHVPIEFLRSNARNPRQRFEEIDLRELADSIRERGIIQPILVRTIADLRDAFEIIAGERRWRAAQQAGLHSVPVIVLQVGDRDALEIAIVENVQRADLSALEEAAGYSRLAAEFGYAHSDIARVVGKSRSHVANTLRLTNLPAHTQDLLTNGAISAGHARALLSLADPDAVADKIVAEGMTVREVESLANSRSEKRNKIRRHSEHDPNTKAIEDKISEALGVQVQIKQIGKKHALHIKVRDLDQLNFICSRLVGG
jgi:ParB family transcriptional regulator, chromosome partitioning protein